MVHLFKDAPSSPHEDDYISNDEYINNKIPNEEYGLFSTPDSISRMLGPKLNHPERTIATAATTAVTQQNQQSSRSRNNIRDVKSSHRRIIGVEGEVRISYISTEEGDDPAAIRIPWLKLKNGGIDRSFFAYHPEQESTTQLKQIQIIETSRFDEYISKFITR